MTEIQTRNNVNIQCVKSEVFLSTFLFHNIKRAVYNIWVSKQGIDSDILAV